MDRQNTTDARTPETNRGVDRTGTSSSHVAPVEQEHRDNSDVLGFPQASGSHTDTSTRLPSRVLSATGGDNHSNENMSQIPPSALRVPEESHVVPNRSNKAAVDNATSRPLPQDITRRPSGLDWIVPVQDDSRSLAPRPKTISERLGPTIDIAKEERARSASKAKFTGYAFNIAIGLQVLLGSLTTGLSAATIGKQTTVTTSILGGFATLVAAYLARVRGSNEPEVSIAREKDLDQFIRECLAFQMDFGHDRGSDHDARLNGFRIRFEELLGNTTREKNSASPI